MKENSKNKMAQMPVGRLMINMGIPMILSMMLQAVYNIVDSAFVSNMESNGEAALNALTLAFPVQMLMVAVGIGTGVGTNALLSKCLGQGNREKASRVTGTAFFLSFIIYAVFLLFGIFGVNAYISSQTSNPVILDMAADYLRICTIMSMGIVFFAIFEKLLQATGKSSLSTIAQITGAVINIILDPILIYGLGFFPEMGVQGAAYATVIGQLASFAVGLVFHLKFNKEITNGVRYLKPSIRIIGEIYAIGLPAIIAQALMSVMTYSLNIIYGKIGENMVTAYGLYYKIQQFVLFAAFGMRDAITPIVSFNHGMKSKKRMTDGIKYGIIYTLIIMLAGTLLIEALANPLAAVFGLSGETQSLCIGAIRIVSLSFVFAGLNIALQGVFQALNGGMESLVISVLRQFLFVIPVAWGAARIIIKTDAYIWLEWAVFPIAELLTLFVAAAFTIRLYKKKIAFLEG